MGRLSTVEQTALVLSNAYCRLKAEHATLERQYHALCQAEQRLRDKHQRANKKLSEILATLKAALTAASNTPAKPLSVLETEE